MLLDEDWGEECLDTIKFFRMLPTKKNDKGTVKEKVKTPKLTEDDRVKLIDQPDLLVVIPLTHQASVRYGSNTKWCTSLPSVKSHFKGYTSEGFLVYILYYKVVDGKRSDDKSKLALFVEPDPNTPNETPEFSVWTVNDKEVVDQSLIDILITEPILEKITEYSKTWLRKKLRFIVGDTITLKSGQGRFNKIPVVIKTKNFEFKTDLKPTDIKSCVVTKISSASVRANVLELNDLKSYDFPEYIVNGLNNSVREKNLSVNIRKQFIL